MCDGTNSCSKSFVGVNEIPTINGLDQYVEFFKTNTSFNQNSYVADVLPVDCLISNLCLQVDGLPPAGKTIQAWVAINATKTTQTLTIDSTTKDTLFYTGPAILAVAGSKVNFIYKITSGAGTQYIRMSALIQI